MFLTLLLKKANKATHGDVSNLYRLVGSLTFDSGLSR